ncbi:alpha/beta hydrolase [Kitasatospora sp. NA04385]|uniref:alpha/beta fold hydrolase n=1 Tax=Kitasatospora sp. NA04385 TaxID=2742135 RepID=UPI00159198EB|nr:alpha/beta hydrolase [Kitasatospora sp. NA04385]QKW21990.1 alpha/beta hydrolase [Kitasatospora sp. NA04385]
MLVLVHGGLWDDPVDAAVFWHRPGVTAGLRAAGLTVTAPDRAMRAGSWDAEARHLAAALPDGPPVVLVAGSNGCSAAVRLALTAPERVRALVLAWPATAGDERLDGLIREAVPAAAGLLAGGTLRGATDAELAGLRLPVAVLPAVPENPVHRRRTADALLALVPGAVGLAGCPEPPHPAFRPGPLVAALAGWIA